MKIVTKVSPASSNPKWLSFSYRVELTNVEESLLEQANAWGEALNYGGESMPIRNFVKGRSQEMMDISGVQAQEREVFDAANILKGYLVTLDGFGESKVREM